VPRSIPVAEALARPGTRVARPGLLAPLLRPDMLCIPQEQAAAKVSEG